MCVCVCMCVCHTEVKVSETTTDVSTAIQRADLAHTSAALGVGRVQRLQAH